MTTLNDEQAVQILMGLLAVPGLSGRERAVADFLTQRLLAAGCKQEWILEDDAHTRIPHDFEMGNLIVRLPGTITGDRLLFSGHMDTVPLVRGAVPKRTGDRIVPTGHTALGADNRTACAAMLTLVEALLQDGRPHPPLTLLFSVGEEIGLWGAKEVDPDVLGRPVMGFNIDGGAPDQVVVGATGAHRWEVEIRGKSAHAGVHPEQGVSAALIAARAVTEISRRGFFGLIDQDGRKGTSNIGVMQGGEASNQVTDHMQVTGESRSHDPAFLQQITATIERCFHEAAASVVSSKGVAGQITFRCAEDYQAFRIAEHEPAVQRTRVALEALGLRYTPMVTNGGLDANYYNAKGIPTVTLGAGQHHPHTQEEYADLPEYLNACRLLLRIVADEACGWTSGP